MNHVVDTPQCTSIQTVKYFCSERFELRQYGESITRFQGMEFLQMACLAVLNIMQTCVIFAGRTMCL